MDHNTQHCNAPNMLAASTDGLSLFWSPLPCIDCRPAPSAPPSGGPPPAGGCPVTGSISLALATATDPAAAHATCFARFAVQVDSSCRLQVVPAPAASRWQYSSVWSAVAVPQLRNMQARAEAGDRLHGWTAAYQGRPCVVNM